MTRRGGMGLKNKGGLGIGYRVSIKFQLQLRSGTGPRKTLPENICITGKVIHRPKGFEYVLLQHQIFDGHRLFWHFYHMSSFKSISNVFKVVKYHSLPNTLPGY